MRSAWWLLFVPAVAQAATIEVRPGSAVPTIAAGVAAASPGDVLSVVAGTYEEEVEITKDLSIVGQGNVVVELELGSIFTVSADVTFVDLALEPDGGRGIKVLSGTTTFRGGSISGNRTFRTPYDGAAIDVAAGATLVVEDATLADNRTEYRANFPPVAGNGGHIRVTGGSVVVRDSLLDEGEAVRGGAIYAAEGATVTLEDVEIRGGQANKGGAVALVSGASLTATRVRFDGPATSSDGGAIWASSAGTVTVADSWILDVVTGGNGTLWAANGGAVTLTRSTWCDNGARDDGGAVLLSDVGTSRIEGNTFVRNSSTRGSGGAVALDDLTVDVAFNDFVGNTAPSGSALAATSGTSPRISSNLFAFHTFTAVSPASGTLGHDAWWSNATNASTALGTGAVTADPIVRGLAADVSCTHVLWRDPTSPLVDAGDPAQMDPDGTRADIGARGGPTLPDEAGDDVDLDGVVALYDCDDGDRTVRPGAVERCDGNDNDCDGVPDSPPPPSADTYYPDGDGDGWGTDEGAVAACDKPSGYAVVGKDCDDANAEINPAIFEICNDIDDNCDGSIDGTDAVDQRTWYSDRDGDGFGSNTRATTSCDVVRGHLLTTGDCDDDDPEVNPNAYEVCDGRDKNCDGGVDLPAPDDAPLWAEDADGDGWGDDRKVPIQACTPPEGLRPVGDCDDRDPTIKPTAPESCAGPDVNCDGLTGDVDHDGDGFSACEDCDDDDPRVFPGAEDVPYDGFFQDCDRTSDFDADGDGYEAIAYGGDDCDDTKADWYPGAPEIPNDGLDQDCDGEEDVYVGLRCSGCQGSGGVSATWLLLLLVWPRRRRRG